MSFAFPPPALIALTLRKAIADGARLLLLVPYAPSAAYWPRVTGAALAGDGKPIHVFRNPSSMLEAAGSYRPASLALFALDFALPMPANLGLVYAAPCGQEHVARPRTSWQSPLDAADRGRINIALHDALVQACASGLGWSTLAKGNQRAGADAASRGLQERGTPLGESNRLVSLQNSNHQQHRHPT